MNTFICMCMHVCAQVPHGTMYMQCGLSILILSYISDSELRQPSGGLDRWSCSRWAPTVSRVLLSVCVGTGKGGAKLYSFVFCIPLTQVIVSCSAQFLLDAVMLRTRIFTCIALIDESGLL